MRIVIAVRYANYRMAAVSGLADLQRVECLQPGSFFRVTKPMDMLEVTSIHLFQGSHGIDIYIPTSRVT